MRQIIFRGKLSHSETQWVEGNLIIAKNGQPYIIPFEVFETDGHHLIIDSDNPFWVKPETVSQFTGMVDKNNKQIFENDIVIYDNHNSLCSFIKGSFVFGSEFDYAYGYEVEIVGNNFDNAEMLAF